MEERGDPQDVVGGLGLALDAGGSAVSWASLGDVGGCWSGLDGDVRCTWLWK